MAAKNFTLFLFLCFSLFTILPAQEIAIHPGTYVKIRASKLYPEPIIGILDTLKSDSIFLKIGAHHTGIALADIRTIAVGMKVYHHTIQGVIFGGLTGALLLGAYFYNKERQAEGFEKVGQPGTGAGIALGAVLGGVIGGVVGQHIVSTTWQIVYARDNGSDEEDRD